MKQEKLLDMLCSDMVRICAPNQIWLFSEKHNPCGELQAVKLCVIIQEGDARQVERRLYIEVESDLPFDVLVYTAEEWERLLAAPMSFAAQIHRTGRVLYAAD